MRLVTRGDLDGLTCSVIITEKEPIDEIVLIHPQDITDRRVEIRPDDIVANLPYHPDCGMWFDHHLQTRSNTTPPEDFRGRFAHAPSAARLVYEYYRADDENLARYAHLVTATDRLDSASLTPEDVTNPRDYILLGYTIDNRSGLGMDFQGYFQDLVEMLKTKRIDEILTHPEVRERVERLKSEQEEFSRFLEQWSRLEDNVVVTDLREAGEVPAGNRFVIYTLFPEANVSLRIHWGPARQSVVAAVGHSIFNRTCRTSVGELMSTYGGGGHRGAGTCLLPVDRADEAIADILATLRKNG